MSFKKYRLIDLSIIIVIGIITECLGTFLSIKALPLYKYSPYAVVALGLICLAVTRYGFYGAITIPFLALANSFTTYLFMKNIAHADFTNSYYVARSIGCLLSLTSPLILLAFYKKKTNDFLTGWDRVAGISLVTAALFVVIIYISIIVNSLVYSYSLDESVFQFGFWYSLQQAAVGILFMMVMNVSLFLSGSFRNSYESILAQRVEEEAEKEYYNTLKQETDDQEEDHQAKGL